MKNRILFVVTVVFCLLFCQRADAQMSKLHFSKYKISGISVRSMRSVDGSLQLTCRNDTSGFTMSEIYGMVYKNGKPFVKGVAHPVRVSQGTSSFEVSGNATLCDGISLWDVLACIAFDPDDYTVDVMMRVTMDSGASRVVDKRGVSVGALLKRVRR